MLRRRLALAAAVIAAAGGFGFGAWRLYKWRCPTADDLFWAIDRGDEASVRSIVSVNPGLVDARVDGVPGFRGLFPDGATPLHVAAGWRVRSGVIEALIDGGADIEACDREGRRPIHYAALAFRGETAVVALVERGADFNAAFGSTTPLEVAITNSKEKAAVALIDAHEPGSAIPSGEVLLQIAVRRGLARVVEALLDRGLSPDGPTKGIPLLHQAADGNVVRLLLKRGAAIDRRDPVGGMTALHAACAAGWLGVAETLIDGGADVNARTEGTSNPGITPLGFAVGGHPEITNLLLSRGVDQRLGDSYGAGPLLYAAASGDVESMRLLVEHGTPIGDRNKFGATALHFASMKSRLLAAEWLLDKGLKADVSDDLDSTPLMGTGSVEMMELLARRGANPSRKNTVGRTALHVAAEQGRIEAAEWLIKMGVPVGSRDESGNTPLQGARAAGREEIAKWLIAHGANE